MNDLRDHAGHLDRDAYYLGVAQAVSTGADCRRRRVGAVIVLHNRILSTGYNGAPAGVPGCIVGQCPRGLLDYEQLAASSDYHRGPGRCTATHAEMNAILYARMDLTGGTLYITAEPCPDCYHLIRSTGLARIVWPDGSLILKET